VVGELPLNQVEQDVHTDGEQRDGAQLESLPGPHHTRLDIQFDHWHPGYSSGQQ
jgi:hypothetical protein